MEEKRNIVSSPNILDTEAMFVVFIGLAGNSDKTPEDFNEFLSIDSVDRRLFLEEYCDYTFKPVDNGKTTVLVYSKKK